MLGIMNGKDYSGDFQANVWMENQQCQKTGTVRKSVQWKKLKTN